MLKYTIELCNKFLKQPDRKVLEKYIVLDNTLNLCNGELVYEKPDDKVNYELRHGYTIHSIQGETAKDKLFIEMNNMRSLRMLYTAFSRAQYLEQIILIK